MEEPTEVARKRNIVDMASDYAETYLKLTVLNINKKTTDISSVASFSMVAALLVFFVFMFLGIAGAFWLGTVLENDALGFLIMAGIFLLIFLLLFLSRKKIFYPFVRNLIVKSIYE